MVSQIEIDGKAPDTIQIHCCVPDDGTEIEQTERTEIQLDTLHELPEVPAPLVYEKSILADIAKVTATGLKKDYKSAETVENTTGDAQNQSCAALILNSGCTG